MRKRRSDRIAGMLCLVLMMAVSLPAQAPPPQAPTARDPTGAPVVAAPKAALPQPTAEAQAVIDQFRQSQNAAIEQLRYLQQSYRDGGRAEDAAAVSAFIRQLLQRPQPVAIGVTAELVLDGLPNRDEPIPMTRFRGRNGQTLMFAIRGRDDQLIWGTRSYTDDSPLETAAVHAGFLRPGQLGIVKVRILPGQDRYQATSQNGVRSGENGRSPGSYLVMSAAVITPVRTSSLSSYRDLVGMSVVVPLVGATAGRVSGTDIYTDDSALATAAVHAGVISAGEFGFVKVTFLPGQARYEPSSRYGVTSLAFDAFQGSYRVESAPPSAIVQLPGEDVSRLVPMDSLRGRTDASFVIRVKGSMQGVVWGSGPYTDDSSIGTAAVHAGLLKPDQEGLVRVIITAGRQSFAASEANGIKSQAYGPWEGSFRLELVGSAK